MIPNFLCVMLRVQVSFIEYSVVLTSDMISRDFMIKSVTKLLDSALSITTSICC